MGTIIMEGAAMSLESKARTIALQEQSYRHRACTTALLTRVFQRQVGAETTNPYVEAAS